MKRIIPLALFMLCTLYAMAQSVVTMGEACTRCDDFQFSQTMLTNDGLSVKKSTDNVVTFTNGSNSTYQALIVELYRNGDTKHLEKAVFKFAPNGKFYSSLGRDLIARGFTLDSYNDTEYRELYSKNEYHIGLDISDNGWIIATFYKD